MKPTYGFVFDLDGTLVDSRIQIQVSLDTTRVNSGLPSSPEGFVEEHLGLPVESLFSDLELKPSDLQSLIQNFRENLLFEIGNGNPIFEGVVSFVQKIKNLGIPIGVATTKPTYLAVEVIKNSPLKDFIDFVQGTDGFPPKPDPEVLRRCMQGLGIENAIMFGDRKEDIRAAKTIGIPSIGIAQSAHSIQDLLAEGATYSFSNFTEIELHSDQIIELIKKV
jgi:phosphoglycolate phosphatase